MRKKIIPLLALILLFIPCGLIAIAQAETVTTDVSTVNVTELTFDNSGQNYFNDMLQPNSLFNLTPAHVSALQPYYEKGNKFKEVKLPYTELSKEQMKDMHDNVNKKYVLLDFWNKGKEESDKIIFLNGMKDPKNISFKKIGEGIALTKAFALEHSAIAYACLKAIKEKNAKYAYVEMQLAHVALGLAKGMGGNIGGGVNPRPYTDNLASVLMAAFGLNKGTSESAVAQRYVVKISFFDLDTSTPKNVPKRSNIFEHIQESLRNTDSSLTMLAFPYDEPYLYDSVPGVPFAVSQYKKVDSVAQELNRLKPTLISSDSKGNRMISRHVYVTCGRSKEGSNSYNAVLGENTAVLTRSEIGKRLKQKYGWTVWEINHILIPTTTGENLEFSPELRKNRVVWFMIADNLINPDSLQVIAGKKKNETEVKDEKK